ncbi:hypothetical protein L2E82_47520 [Cichorium intybus]|uniref:Uncharacterized protein n=1 Tax=Cichorium intybus TaxID=13427 RepID=A0ACB8YX78_CICIN|nr:hypothetical protein L2E82_47520 [Cichorium intybus]
MMTEDPNGHLLKEVGHHRPTTKAILGIIKLLNRSLYKTFKSSLVNCKKIPNTRCTKSLVNEWENFPKKSSGSKRSGGGNSTKDWTYHLDSEDESNEKKGCSFKYSMACKLGTTVRQNVYSKVVEVVRTK